MRATAWNNGAHHAGGAGYGLKVSVEDRDRHFERDWSEVIIEVPGRGEVVVPLSESFWRDCREIRNAELGRWLHASGQAPWPRGRPPKFDLQPVRGNRFLIEDTAQ